MKQAPKRVESWETGMDTGLLKFVGAASVKVPEGFVSALKCAQSI
jgi:hypothetical protein